MTEALSGSACTGAEGSPGGCCSHIQRRRGGFHLTRSTPNGEGRSQAQTWLFPTLYDLLLFARAQGFAEVDPEATDWHAVFGSAYGSAQAPSSLRSRAGHAILWL